MIYRTTCIYYKTKECLISTLNSMKNFFQKSYVSKIKFWFKINFVSIFRTVLELIVAGLLLTWLCIKGIPIIAEEEIILCPIADYWYVCSGHPQKFYLYVLFATIGILCLYIFCCLFNLAWLFIPQLGSLSGVMRKYRKEFKDQVNFVGQ